VGTSGEVYEVMLKERREYKEGGKNKNNATNVGIDDLDTNDLGNTQNTLGDGSNTLGNTQNTLNDLLHATASEASSGNQLETFCRVKWEKDGETKSKTKQTEVLQEDIIVVQKALSKYQKELEETEIQIEKGEREVEKAEREAEKEEKEEKNLNDLTDPEQNSVRQKNPTSKTSRITKITKIQAKIQTLKTKMGRTRITIQKLINRVFEYLHEVHSRYHAVVLLFPQQRDTIAGPGKDSDEFENSTWIWPEALIPPKADVSRMLRVMNRRVKEGRAGEISIGARAAGEMVKAGERWEKKFREERERMQALYGGTLHAPPSLHASQAGLKNNGSDNPNQTHQPHHSHSLRRAALGMEPSQETAVGILETQYGGMVKRYFSQFLLKLVNEGNGICQGLGSSSKWNRAGSADVADSMLTQLLDYVGGRNSANGIAGNSSGAAAGISSDDTAGNGGSGVAGDDLLRANWLSLALSQPHAKNDNSSQPASTPSVSPSNPPQHESPSLLCTKCGEM